MNSSAFHLPRLRSLCFHCRQNVLSRLLHRGFLTAVPQKNTFQKDSIENLASLDSIKPNKSSSSSSSSSLSSLVSSMSSPRISAVSYAPRWSPAEPVETFTPRPPHHIHVYSTRHNCHITLSDGNRQPLISVSSGSIGFRKAARGSYDAGFQLGAYIMGRIRQQGLADNMQHIEIVFRDFGPAREAFTKILLGTEGKVIRDKIIRVMDATRLKFGGTRSKKPRRLG